MHVYGGVPRVFCGLVNMELLHINIKSMAYPLQCILIKT